MKGLKTAHIIIFIASLIPLAIGLVWFIVKYDSLTFTQVLNDDLSVMDMTAATLCRDNHLPMLVFDLSRPDNILDAVMGKQIGTVITEG